MSTPFNNIGASLIPVFNTHASATESQARATRKRHSAIRPAP